MTLRCAAVFAALSFFLMVGRLAAQDVTLTSSDGAVEISGTLLGFDGEFYRVETKFGELTVDGSGVNCEGPGCPNLAAYVAEVTFSGSSAMAEVLVPALIEGFALRNGYRTQRQKEEGDNFRYDLLDGQSGGTLARFYFYVSNTDEGFADLLANETDVVMALREIRPQERQLAKEAGMGDMTDTNRSLVLALDAMVPVVAPGNPVRTISTLDLARVFAGEVTNWTDLGGPDAPIALHLPDPGFGLAQAVEDRLIKVAGREFTPDIARHTLSSDLARAVVTDPFAIGIASYAESGAARALTLTGACGFTLAATRRTIKTEDYPLNSPMFLYLPARRLPKIARAFLAYTRGPSAQIVIRRSGFVDQVPEEVPLGLQGDRLSNAIQAAGEEVDLDTLRAMIDVLRPMQRLSLSFRFETGSSRLDAQSRSNVAQFTRELESGVFDGRRMVFVGFSDGEGAAAGNLRISEARAKAVRDAVLDNAEAADLTEEDIEIAAFGEAMPMACDDTDWGRQVNRRVEVWLQ
ncbi:MAG: phosphate ABC transporter substrate-binding/OmpA family protein [Paracoccaceae bacterium]